MDFKLNCDNFTKYLSINVTQIFHYCANLCTRTVNMTFIVYRVVNLNLCSTKKKKKEKRKENEKCLINLHGTFATVLQRCLANVQNNIDFLHNTYIMIKLVELFSW